ncbi:MAG: AAA family ATPase [Candidatus Glassbacteria bacterium]|nr:AAA family ATPase [Candidatus Glassbacteria bacterium]
MYLDFYGLQEKPFSLTPDPRFLFLSDSHRQALDHMTYGIQEREGFILIAGDIGTGKTTICRELLDRLDDNVATALILNPLLSEQELLEAVVEDFALGIKRVVAADGGGEKSSRKVFDSLDEETQNALELNPLMPGERVLRNILEKVQQPAAERPTKKELIDRLNAYLLELVEQGGNAVLIIDEAQNLSLEVLEQVRILSNLETTKQKLLQIVLVGQLELKRKLESTALRQLNQRIAIRYQLNPLRFEETKRYIEHRLFVAGSNSSVTFSEDAFQQLYDYSRGVPRLVNLICERCLLAGYVDQARKLDGNTVLRCRESLEGNMEAGPAPKIEQPQLQDKAPAGEVEEDLAGAAGEHRPDEAVEQPWERKKSGLSGPLKTVIIGLAMVALIVAASLLTWNIAKRNGGAPAGTTTAAPSPQREGIETNAVQRSPEVPAVRLAFSLQLGAFRSLEDALEQARLFDEQGLERELFVVPLHVAQLGGRWYRLFYGGFPSSDASRTELGRLEERGILRQGRARVVETSLAYNLGDFGDRASAEQRGGEYMRRWRIPFYVLALHKEERNNTWRLYAGAFENRDQAAFLGDRIDEAGLSGTLVERLGYWPFN